MLELGNSGTAISLGKQDEPLGVLAAWTALECLSPQTYTKAVDLVGGDRRCVAKLSDGLPWTKNEFSRPNYRLYYQVVLGSVAMDRATDRLLRAFGDDEERGQVKGQAAIAAILLDRNGLLLEDKGVAVSSFAWALPLALKLNLGSLAAWPAVEQRVVQALEQMLRRQDHEGRDLPVDLQTIDRAFRWLVAQFGLPDDLVERPALALRVYHYYKSKNPPEVQLLNSFFLGDLSKASKMAADGGLPTGLRAYLGLAKPAAPVDLLADRSAVERAVAPGLVPLGRWPTRGGHPLVLLQQAAVKLARQELGDREGIVAVNGPPGTGKTTLLRDLVAAAVVERALAMAAFGDPEDAFTPSGQKMSAGDKAFFNLYKLHPSLRGHEMVVASSNNKAVENVSRELPASKAIGRDGLTFFKSISDNVHGSSSDEDDAPGDGVETWGMIAAVLGNAKNRAAFAKRFWWDDDRGFRVYLKAAKGDAVVRERTDPATGRVERTMPTVVGAEAPPTPAQAKSNWKRARAHLLSLKVEIQAEMAALERIRLKCLERAAKVAEAARLETELARVNNALAVADVRRDTEAAAAEQSQAELLRREAEVKASRRRRPGFLARLFRSKRSRNWLEAHRPVAAAAEEARRMNALKQEQLRDATAAAARLTEEAAAAGRRLAAVQQETAGLGAEIDAVRPRLGDRIVDEGFFARDHGPRHLTAPWIPAELHGKREDLFMAALAVHKAFIDAAAQKMMHNVGALMNVLSAGPPTDPEKRSLMGDLWSTLFIAVPLVSTTFASVERMFGGLPPGSIGWLLIDEAGQAVPQAAVGAVMRSRRTVVVGDPLQIPPVVTLPERLTHKICDFFRVRAPLWAAPEASVQTVADGTSTFQSAFRSDQGPRRVGIPLLVHRRCQEPMFGISNRIAYDRQMVHAVAPASGGVIGAALGPSRWLDIDGQSDTKWCPAEGDLVVSMLRQLARAGVRDPDIFLISPFRIVAHELRRRIEAEREVAAQLGFDAKEWVYDRVGTIHTVQGREAEGVILVLGAPASAQNRARAWAAETPNILNVAVSRAKESLYVVGSHAAWSSVGHARELASLPRERRTAS